MVYEGVEYKTFGGIFDKAVEVAKEGLAYKCRAFLDSYVSHILAANNGYMWYSWDDVELMGRILNLPTVPVLGTGYVTSVEDLKNVIEEYMKEPSAYGDEKEGVVIRTADEFPVLVDGKSVFHQHVCKYVRANHIQTDEHWTRHWKKAMLTEDN